MTKVTTAGPALGRAPVIHHRPAVRRGTLVKFWWSQCPCGYARHYSSWKRALIDALIHSEELR